VNAKKRVGPHEVLELTSNVQFGTFSDDEKGMRGISKIGNSLSDQVEAVSLSN